MPPLLVRLPHKGRPLLPFPFPANTGWQGATGTSSTIRRTAHGLSASQRVVFSSIVPSSGTGLDPSIVYYVLAAGLTADTFEISETDGGTPLQLALALSANMAVVPETTSASPSQNITITAVTDLVNAASHGFVTNDIVYFTGLVGGAGLSESTAYYVLAAGLTASAFKVSLSSAGVALDITADYTAGVLWRSAVYTAVTDPNHVMAPPTNPAAPTAPTVTSALVSTVVRLTVALNTMPENKARLFEVQVTHKYSGATPDWTGAQVFDLTEGSTAITIPALGGTKYAVRTLLADVYGNFSAASTVVEHTTLAGPDSVSLINGPATVTINATGITIENGSLILKDEFGQTTLFASGFSGSWFDLIKTGLYNGRFLAGTIGAVPNGRTAALPYWTLTGDATNTVLTLLSTGGLRATWTTVDTRTILSDKVPVVPLEVVEFSFVYNATLILGTAQVNAFERIRFYDSSNALISTVTPAQVQVTIVGTTGVTKSPVITVIAPAGAVSVTYELNFQQSGVTNAGNVLDVLGIGVKAVATGAPAAPVISAETVETVATTGTINNLAINAKTTLLRFNGGASVVLNGIVAPLNGNPAPRRLLWVQSLSTTPVIIVSNAAASTLGNRFNFSLDGSRIRLYAQEMMLLAYDPGAVSWALVSPSIRLPGPLADTQEGYSNWDDTLRALIVGDSVRAKPVSPVGFLPFAYPEGYVPESVVNGLALPINGGAIAVPIRLTAPMLLESYVLRNIDAAGAHTINARLYVDRLDNTGTINEIASSNATWTFTPGAASDQASTTLGGLLLGPGLYWLVIRNTSATVVANIARGAAPTGIVNGAFYQSATLAGALAATLDMVTGWAKSGRVPAVALQGRVFGGAGSF